MGKDQLAVATAVLLVAATGLLTGCSREVVRSHLMARCEAGELVVRENVRERRGFSGTDRSVQRSLEFHMSDGRRVPVQISEHGSYRAPARDRLAIFQQPRQGDWQGYVDPARVDSKGYAALVQCLETSAEVPQADLSALATLRYGSLDGLRKRYQCGRNASLDVREDGLIYWRDDAVVLVGAIVNAGTVAELDSVALRYLSSRTSNPIREPLAHFHGCRDPSGATLFGRFRLSVLPEGMFWATLQAALPDSES